MRAEADQLEIKYAGPSEEKYIGFPIPSSALYDQPVAVWSARPASDARVLKKEWPQFLQLYDEYNAAWNNYLEYLCGKRDRGVFGVLYFLVVLLSLPCLTVWQFWSHNPNYSIAISEIERTHPERDYDSMTTKELEKRYLGFKKANNRLKHFVTLTKDQPRELRHMLQSRKTVDEVFRVFLPPDEAQGIGKEESASVYNQPICLASRKGTIEFDNSSTSSDGDSESADAQYVDPDEIDYNDYFNRRTVNTFLQFQCRVDGCNFRYYDTGSRRKDLISHYLDKHV